VAPADVDFVNAKPRKTVLVTEDHRYVYEQIAGSRWFGVGAHREVAERRSGGTRLNLTPGYASADAAIQTRE